MKSTKLFYYNAIHVSYGMQLIIQFTYSYTLYIKFTLMFIVLNYTKSSHYYGSMINSDQFTM